MDKAIAQELWGFANNRRAHEFNKWNALPSRTSKREWEAQQMRVASWATACNELYYISRGETIYHDNNNQGRIERSQNTEGSASQAEGNLPTVSEASGESMAAPLLGRSAAEG